MTTWCAAVLVGGRARRLGGIAKPLLDLAGRSMLARQASALEAVGVRPFLVTADPAPYADLGYAIVADEVSAGALGGLYTALVHGSEPHVLVLAGDLPFVTAPFLAHLAERRFAAEAVVPRPDGRWQPLCAVYDRHVAAIARRRLDDGDWRVTAVLDDLVVEAVDDADLAAFDADGRLLLNVNTPDDYRLAVDHAALEK
jgi:molybdopterin-guanine dinucleotide biosynthesis protein A